MHPEAKMGGAKGPATSHMGSKKARSVKAKANAHEKDLAESLGGRAQPASGALEGHKGDIKLDKFLLDSKETVGSRITIEGKDLTKITREAIGEGKVPGLILTVKDVPFTTASEWVLIPLPTFAQMLRADMDEDL